MLVLLLLSPF
jgi:serine/threonine protein kinase